jgi:hypothetical protein
VRLNGFDSSDDISCWSWDAPGSSMLRRLIAMRSFSPFPEMIVSGFLNDPHADSEKRAGFHDFWKADE